MVAPGPPRTKPCARRARPGARERRGLDTRCEAECRAQKKEEIADLRQGPRFSMRSLLESRVRSWEGPGAGDPPPRALGSRAADRPLGSRARRRRAGIHAHDDPPPAPTAPTRVALVGAGFIADFHLEILAETPGVEVVAVCDADLRPGRGAWRGASACRAPWARPTSSAPTRPTWPTCSSRRRCTSRWRGACSSAGSASSSRSRWRSPAPRRARWASSRRRAGSPLGVNHNALHHPAFAAILARAKRGEIGRVEHVRACLSVPLRQLDARRLLALDVPDAAQHRLRAGRAPAGADPRAPRARAARRDHAALDARAATRPALPRPLAGGRRGRARHARSSTSPSGRPSRRARSRSSAATARSRPISSTT